jgi:hypothetical protein
VFGVPIFVKPDVAIVVVFQCWFRRPSEFPGAVPRDGPCHEKTTISIFLTLEHLLCDSLPFFALN